jgi:hypothetical protein
MNTVAAQKGRITLARWLKPPAAAFLSALAVRFTLLIIGHVFEDWVHHYFLSWGLEALMVADSLATGHGFAHGFPHYPFATGWVAPIYVVLLSYGEILFRLRGHHLLIYGQVINVLFSALTCFPIYKLGARLFDQKFGSIAAWLWTFSPLAVVMPVAWIWDQSLSALIFAWLLFYTYLIKDSCSEMQWTGYGLLWAVAALTNPTLCVLLPFFGFWLCHQRYKESLPSVPFLARAALFFLLALTPWTMRNYFEFGAFSFVKTNFGVELWLGNNPDVKYVYSPQHHPMEDYREYRLLVLTNEPVYSRLKQREAIAFVKANPRRFATLVGHKVVDTWSGVFDAFLSSYIQSLVVRRILVLCTGIMSILGFAGLYLGLRSRVSDFLPFAFCMLIFPIPYYATHSSLRYRHPIDPALTILVTLVLVRFVGLFRTSNRRAIEAGRAHQVLEEAQPVHVLTKKLTKNLAPNALGDGWLRKGGKRCGIGRLLMKDR